MRILLVDDEAPAREELRYILGTLLPEAELRTAGNGTEALAAIERSGFDAVFLDIEMPGVGGLEVAAELVLLDEPPLLVFATAYDQHAVEAFELAALDYVLKPFSETRLQRCAARLRAALGDPQGRNRAAAAVREQFERLRAALGSSSDRVWAERANENRVPLDPAEVSWFATIGGGVEAALRSGERLRVRYTLSELETALAERGFLRVQRGHLVNLAHVAEVVPWFSGALRLRMRDAPASEIAVSRRYARRFKQVSGWR